MIKEELAKNWRSAGLADEKVLNAFMAVPREEFVLKELQAAAYEDCPLPILCGKTISQPTTTIIMINALEIREGEKILEIGTGSGYHAALMGRITGETGKIISLEVVPELVAFARENLAKSAIDNVVVIEEDGSQGYEKESPYDKIIVTAACPETPKALIEQLRTGGVLVAPIGSLQAQQMTKIRKTERGLEKESLGEFIFLPMVGKHGFKEEEIELI